jgi:hypothetical protein
MNSMASPFHQAVLNAMDPDVPEDERRLVAWRNATQYPGDLVDEWRLTREGRLINWYEYGKCTPHGWHVDHCQPLALGGRHNASNLVARQWEDNTRAGASVKAVLNALRGS